MKRQKIVIGNWKMNLTVPESTVVIEKYLKEIVPSKTEVVVCPSFLDIYAAEKALAGSEIKVGAQNVHYEDEGPYTGEVSADQVKGFAKYCIVGHSERRRHFGETDKVVAKKAAVCVRHDITPIICVGESLHEHMDGLTKMVVTSQTEASLSELTPAEIAEVVIAYEPVWSIGTEHADKPTDAAKVINNIRNLIKVLYGEKAAQGVRIIYGGSVTAKNVENFLAEDLDGFLVGGASLDHAAFAKIAMATENKVTSTAIHSHETKRRPSPKTAKDKPKAKKVGRSQKASG